jgi:hypothetical protein
MSGFSFLGHVWWWPRVLVATCVGAQCYVASHCVHRLFLALVSFSQWYSTMSHRASFFASRFRADLVMFRAPSWPVSCRFVSCVVQILCHCSFTSCFVQILCRCTFTVHVEGCLVCLPHSGLAHIHHIFPCVLTFASMQVCKCVSVQVCKCASLTFQLNSACLNGGGGGRFVVCNTTRFRFVVSDCDALNTMMVRSEPGA